MSCDYPNEHRKQGSTRPISLDSLNFAMITFLHSSDGQDASRVWRRGQGLMFDYQAKSEDFSMSRKVGKVGWSDTYFYVRLGEE